MRDRFSIATATGALLGVFGLCCGLPLLLSAGVAGSIAGISIGSSLLIVLGVAALALAGWRRRERRYRACRPVRNDDVGEHPLAVRNPR